MIESWHSTVEFELRALEPFTTKAHGWAHWSVLDPARDGTKAGFDAAYNDLTSRVGALAPRLSPSILITVRTEPRTRMAGSGPSAWAGQAGQQTG